MPITRRSVLLSSGANLVAPAIAQGRTRATARGDAVEKHLPALERLVGEVMRKTGVPGMSVAVVSHDRVVYLEGFGLRRAGRPEPVDADTVFQLASLSKPVATTVVAGLVGDGVVSWDDRIVRHFPDFALSDPWVTREATLRDMFCHRSGLPDHAGDLLEDIGYDRAEVLHRLRHVKPAGGFRAHYAYTNFGFTAAAVAAARAAGKSGEELSSERLYRPLGMANTSSRHADFTMRVNRAFGHVRRNGVWVVGEQRDPDAQSPAGGVSSSARDMAAWLRLQLGRGSFEGRDIVKADALDETHRPQIVSSPADPMSASPGFYALGWDIGYDVRPRVHWGHSGAFALGAATCVTILPAERLGVVVLSNSSPIGAPEAISRSFVDLVVHGKIERDWLTLFGGVFAKLMAPTYGRDADYNVPPTGAAPPAPLAAYAGNYGNALYGPIKITNDVNSLSLAFAPKFMPYVLHHYDGDIFTFQPPGENAFGPSAVRFMLDVSHKAMSVRIDCLNENGQGAFVRS